jgi:hypothetical protein
VCGAGPEQAQIDVVVLQACKGVRPSHGAGMRRAREWAKHARSLWCEGVGSMG